MTIAAETDLGRVRRARRMSRTLAAIHPDAHCELDHETPLQLAVATILSAQCTDQRVNEVTPKLFARYPSAAAYAAADRAELEEMIKPTGFFRNKTDSLIKLGQALVDRYDGEVPGKMAELDSLPGIGRKTANVILGNAFDVPGITVDTHFGRLVSRWQWTTETDPVKVEHAVGKLIERRDWTMLSHRVIFHGRRVCHARKPACGVCLLARDCPSYGAGPTEPEVAAKLVKGPRAAEIIAQATAGQPNRTPANSTPATANPATAKPATAKPATAKPATAKPATAKPATAKPATAKPATAKPAKAKLANGEPANGKPAKGVGRG